MAAEENGVDPRKERESVLLGFPHLRHNPSKGGEQHPRIYRFRSLRSCDSLVYLVSQSVGLSKGTKQNPRMICFTFSRKHATVVYHMGQSVGPSKGGERHPRMISFTFNHARDAIVNCTVVYHVGQSVGPFNGPSTLFLLVVY